MLSRRRSAERISRGVLAGLLAACAAEPALAAPPPSAAPTVSELIVTASKTVSELTVTAKLKCLAPDRMAERARRPKVVSAFPEKGATVRPGLLVVRVTFDQPMACDGALTQAPPLANPCPGKTQEMLLSYDRRTVRTVCIVEPGVQYGLWVSQDPATRSFIGLGGLPSEAYRLEFATSAAPTVTTVCEAMFQDAFTANEIRKRGDVDCAAEGRAAKP